MLITTHTLPIINISELRRCPVCHTFFNRMKLKFNIQIEMTKENQDLVNSYLGAITEEQAEKMLEQMDDAQIYAIYALLFKRRKKVQHAEGEEAQIYA